MVVAIAIVLKPLRHKTVWRLNPDSAVAIDRNREAQPFRSKVDGFVPLSRHRSAVLRADVEVDRNDLRDPKKVLETTESDAFAAPGSHLASSLLVELRNPGLKEKTHMLIRMLRCVSVE